MTMRSTRGSMCVWMEILFGRLEEGGEVEVHVKDGEIYFNIKEKAEASGRESAEVSRGNRRES